MRRGVSRRVRREAGGEEGVVLSISVTRDGVVLSMGWK